MVIVLGLARFVKIKMPMIMVQLAINIVLILLYKI